MATASEMAGFKFNHTMLRVKDPKASLMFYQDVLGMKLIKEVRNDDAKFSLYFLAFDHDQSLKDIDTKSESEKWTAAISRVLELTWNHGTESDPEFKGYANGNSEPGRGFGHIAVTVDDLDKACDRFEKLNVRFQKRPTDGKMRNIAFVLDPDGFTGIIAASILFYSLRCR
ncbi:Lactoylglutathione lyase [Tulasnella sp. JGI-2019a]|nr:Lactoylglutathione lyase [Tulasnella sp. JGI-2019a]